MSDKSKMILFLIFLAILQGCATPKGPVPVPNPARMMSLLQSQCALGPRNPGSQAHLAIHNVLKTMHDSLADKVVSEPFAIVGPARRIVMRIARHLGHQPFLAAVHSHDKNSGLVRAGAREGE